MSAQLKASIIIPVHNNASTLALVLASLREQTLDTGSFEVIVVDDGSTDSVRQVIETCSQPYNLLFLQQENRGAASARNQGAAQSGGEILVFLDSDVLPSSTLLIEYLNSHRAHQRALIVGKTQAPPPKNSSLFLSIMGEALFSWNLGDAKKEASFLEVLSRNMSLRHSSFQELGGFDEDFPPKSGFEDTEFAYRASRLGYSLIYDPDAAGIHLHSATLMQVCRHMYCYQTSAALLMTKHPEIKGQIAHLHDKEPIDWGQDKLQLVGRKLLRQMLAHTRSIWLMEKVVAGLERWYPSPTLLRFMYWKILGSYLFLGFREGLKQYGEFEP